MTPKTSRVGGLLVSYLGFCVLVGALWVHLSRRREGVSDRQDLEALVGGMMFFGTALGLWFATEHPFIEIGPIGDGVAGFAFGVLVGFVVTGVSLAIRLYAETTGGL